MGAHGGGPARLPGGLAVHLAADPQRQRRLCDALPRAVRGRAHRGTAAAAGLRAGAQRARAGRGRTALLGDRRPPVRHSARRPLSAAEPRHAPGCSSRCCATPGCPSSWQPALDDAAFDDEIRAETEEALTLTGRDVGTPILHFQPPGGTAFFGPGDQQAAQPATTPARCGITSSRWRRSPASPRSSAACGSGPSWPVSASTPNRLASKRTGTAAAVGSRSSLRIGRRGKSVDMTQRRWIRNSKLLALLLKYFARAHIWVYQRTNGRVGARLLWFPAALVTTTAAGRTAAHHTDAVSA